MIRGAAAVLLCSFAALAPLSAQQQEGTPEEYRAEEFPPFLRALRRGEIVALGTFPLTLFVSLEGFDLYRFAASGGAPEYAPWPFRPPNAVPYEPEQTLGVFLTAISVSALIAAADFVIGRVQEKRRESAAVGEGAPGGAEEQETAE